MTSRFHLVTLGVWVLGSSGCGDSQTQVGAPASDAAAGSPDVAVGPNAPGVDLAHWYNVLVEQSHGALCKVCPCGGFSPGSPQGEACTGAIIDQYPEARAQINCRIGIEEAYFECLSKAADCPAGDACTATRTTDEENCPVFDSTAAMAMPPPICRAVP